jgi:putative ABC transport system permease protein
MAPKLFELFKGKRTPALAIVITLAVGVGAITALSSIVAGVGSAYRLLGEDATVWIMKDDPARGVRLAPSLESVTHWKTELGSIETLAAFSLGEVVLRERDSSRQVPALRTDHSLFRVVRSSPRVGRELLASDAIGPSVTLVSEVQARSAFGSAKDALGRHLILEGMPHEIVGVYSSHLQNAVLPGAQFDVVIPFSRQPGSVNVIGRLREGASVAAAQRQLDAVDANALEPAATTRHVVLAAPDMLDPKVSRMFAASFAGATLLLIVTCVNLMHLFAAHRDKQRNQLAIRWALGASTPSLVKWRFGRPLAWSLVGAVGGLILAQWILSTVALLAPHQFAFLQQMQLQMGTFVIAAGSAAIVVVVASVGQVRPSLGALITSLRADSRLGSSSPKNRLFGRLHVASLVACAVILAIGAIQVFSTITNLARVDLGFRSEAIHVATVRLPAWKYGDQAQRAGFLSALNARLDAASQVARFAVTSGSPLSTALYVGDVRFGETGRTVSTIGLGSVGAGYFSLLGQRLLAGREFDAAEARNNAMVVILSASAAKVFGSPQRAVGQSMWFGKDRREIVGVVADTRAPGLVDSLKGDLAFVPFNRPRQTVSVVFRPVDKHGATQVQSLIAAVDSDAVVTVVPLTDALHTSIADTRFLALLLSFMAVVAIAMALAGVYAVLDQFVAAQSGSIAIRMAVGATPAAIQRWVIWNAMAPALPGLAIGVLASYPFSRILSAQLFGIDPNGLEARLIVLVAIMIAIVGATWMPAHRASHVSVQEILRQS